MLNPELKRVIQTLNAASRKGGKAIWGALAEEMDKAKRSRVIVNLSKISRHTEAGDVVAVPGKVLAAGSLSHPVTVAAYSFSEGAREKIAGAGSRAISLLDLLEEGVEPSRIKILK
ncbi:50S ribosomal protein L18e [Candidatus Bathyarchaeota archaeon]|nr:MAG: 50S ribosomal protein L18e [Candidatus Bathyarchaeota archaeon]